MGRRTELALGILNGAVGDYLHRTNNGLATEMSFVPPAPASGSATPSRVAVFLHGLMCTEDVWMLPDGSDYGALLARDFGYAPLYVRYNSGRPVGESGHDLAELLEGLVTERPIDEILLVGFSMGGLVIRSASHVASLSAMRWLSLVRRAFYLGTPHLGSPWERAGRVLTSVLRAIPDPYTRLAADLGDLRSKGMKDLGDPAHPFPLLPQIRHHLVAGLVDNRMATLFGDGMVPLPSSTDGLCVNAQALPPDHVKILPGLAHMALAHHPDVYAQIRAWCDVEAA